MSTQTIGEEAAPLPALDDRRSYEGVRTRRMLAFVIDYAIVLLLCIPVAVIIFFVGLLTLGLGFALYGILFALVALPYVGFTMGGPKQATPGMQIMGIMIARTDGQPVDSMLAGLHAVVFWALNVFLTPLILLASLFLDRKRLVHDMLLGTVVLRSQV
ncbi:RDD family protein [Pararhizobium haloflavum]|uniref:RDD family protein n=1 Tax=Pararhizobium haloflavum TaxID=2037914 RepID=UPI000C1965B4|nr:RDD family protein [Pararhizobium haloflavum]